MLAINKRRVVLNWCRGSCCHHCPLRHEKALDACSDAEIAAMFDRLMHFLFGENPFLSEVPHV